MKLTKLAVATTLTLAAYPTLSAEINTDDVFKKLDFFGSVKGNVIKEANHDHQTQIQLAEVGMRGVHETDYGNLFVTLAAEYADNETQDNDEDIYLSQANLIFKSHDYGTLVLGDGYKGAYLHLFKPVDIFDTNNQHRSSGSTLFVNQGVIGTNTLSYTTPKFLGKLTATAAVVSAFDDNDTEADNFALRLAYVEKNYSIKVQRSDANAHDGVDANGKDLDFERYIGMAEYHNDTFAIAATYEFAKDHHKYGDGRMYGTSGTYHATDSLTFKLGYQHSEFDTEIGKWQDDSLYLANVSFDITNNFRVYAEYADFADDTQDDNVSLGTVFNF